MTVGTRIEWMFDREPRRPFGRVSPDPARWHPIGFPAPSPDRPWIYDVVIDDTRHDGILRIMDFQAEGAVLVAEGRVAPDSGWRFQRWRFADR